VEGRFARRWRKSTRHAGSCTNGYRAVVICIASVSRFHSRSRV
jgi:hypothetical protein